MKIFGRISKKAVLISTASITVVAVVAVGVIFLQPKPVLETARASITSAKTIDKTEAATKEDESVNITNSETVAAEPNSSVAPSISPKSSPTDAELAQDIAMTKMCEGVQAQIQRYYIDRPGDYKDFNALLNSSNNSFLTGIKLNYQPCVDAGKIQPVK